MIEATGGLPLGRLTGFAILPHAASNSKAKQAQCWDDCAEIRGVFRVSLSQYRKHSPIFLIIY